MPQKFYHCLPGPLYKVFLSGYSLLHILLPQIHLHLSAKILFQEPVLHPASDQN
jgi:hypothetical protein